MEESKKRTFFILLELKQEEEEARRLQMEKYSVMKGADFGEEDDSFETLAKKKSLKEKAKKVGSLLH